MMPVHLEDEEACLTELRRLNQERIDQVSTLGAWVIENQSLPVPEHILPGIARYLSRGIIPGSFLEAMLTNDLRGVMQTADDINAKHLPAIWSFLYNNIPSSAWGSRDNLLKWSEERQALADNPF